MADPQGLIICADGELVAQGPDGSIVMEFTTDELRRLADELRKAADYLEEGFQTGGPVIDILSIRAGHC
ncbi:hypothetical protein B7H23_12920 [Notoacmeibacter marinus]|uniref:Uncharacterized protein n=1 Tax=Notoacmeibacter marinus TaxID=1876515 RepID=A0A231UTA8_9HYPH|nr:hypothetical protein [Notoacmeibacter marinus]OXS99101.1 hypothetical protein B7H23_12920 [Notoacmeibacter marinus]